MCLFPLIIKKVALWMPKSSSTESVIDFIRPLAVPAGIKPNVVFWRNSSLSYLLIAPFTASWIRPSPDMVMIPSYCPIWTSVFVISWACIALYVCFISTSMCAKSNNYLATVHFLGAKPIPPNGFKRARIFLLGGSWSVIVGSPPYADWMIRILHSSIG